MTLPQTTNDSATIF